MVRRLLVYGAEDLLTEYFESDYALRAPEAR